MKRRAVAAEYERTHGLNYLLYVEPGRKPGTVMDRFGVEAFPTLVLLSGEGDVLRVEKLSCEAGEIVQFNEVLVVGDQIGAPFVAGAAVQATVIDQIKGEKTIHFVRRRRKHSSKRTKGHRQ